MRLKSSSFDQYIFYLGVQTLIKILLRDFSLRGLMQFFFRISVLGRAHVRRNFLAAKLSVDALPVVAVVTLNSACNLRCHGCFTSDLTGQLPIAVLRESIETIETLGTPCALLIGGEPTLYGGLRQVIEEYKSTLFIIFSNGTLPGAVQKLCEARASNLFFLFSVEGSTNETDMRRGAGVFDKIRETMLICRQYGISFGFSVTVTHENIRQITLPGFVEEMRGAGCVVGLFLEFNPLYGDGRAKAASYQLTDEERLFFRDSFGMLRDSARIPLAALPVDEESMGGCQGGRGLVSIGPNGDVEACPFLRVKISRIGSQSFYREISVGLAARAGERACSSCRIGSQTVP